MLISIIFFLSIELVNVFGQVTQPGYCPNIATHPRFDVQLYTGRWYEREKFPTSFQQNQICVSADYYLKPTGGVRVINRGYDVRQGRYVTISGDAIQNPASPGQLGVRFFPGQPRQPYNVLATDYHSFSLVFSCQQSSNTTTPSNQQFLWILTRSQRGITPSMRLNILMKANGYGINTSYLTKTDQRNCP